MTSARALLALVALLTLAGCAAMKGGIEAEAREQDAGDFSDPAATEGNHELDSTLCWQSIQQTPGETVDQAYAECMRKKGWSK